VTLRHTLQGHEAEILKIAWSPDGSRLASPSVDKTVRVWDPRAGALLQVLEGHHFGVNHVAWSPEGRRLASCSFDRTIRIWDWERGEQIGELQGHADDITTVAWSPDGQLLASGSADRVILIWSTATWQILERFDDHSAEVNWVGWSPDGKTLASASGDGTIGVFTIVPRASFRLRGHSDWIIAAAWAPRGDLLGSASEDRTVRVWKPRQREKGITLEGGHTHTVSSVSFSSDGRLLASKGMDGVVRLWECRTWKPVATLDEPASSFWPPGLAFHPGEPTLATLGAFDQEIRIWEIDADRLLGQEATPSVYYANAKVVLVGETGVGKSGLGLVLSGQPFAPTESTHCRRIWPFDGTGPGLAVGGPAGRSAVRPPGSSGTVCETLLWDLAGQPDYRLIHQLHLGEAVIALIVLDARDSDDPLAAVHFWVRALEQARSSRGDSALPLKKFLVEARIDVGRLKVDPARLREVAEQLGIGGVFATSAKENRGIAELTGAIRGAIPWEALPKVSSSQFFQDIKEFLVAQKAQGRVLTTTEDLCRTYVAERPGSGPVTELLAPFDTCIGRLEAVGLVRRLSFGGFVLLQPELIDAYAGAMINSAGSAPDDAATLAEDRALKGDFAMPRSERVADAATEQILRSATVEDLLRHQIALREPSNRGNLLVFPARFTQEGRPFDWPVRSEVCLEFVGHVPSIYATLAVRLAYSGLFAGWSMWRDGATFAARAGGTCGIEVREVEPGRGEMALFYDHAAAEPTRFLFEAFVLDHLKTRSAPDEIRRRREFYCSQGHHMDPEHVRLRRERGFDRIRCPVDDDEVLILDNEERLSAARMREVPSASRTADRAAEQKASDTRRIIMEQEGYFDVFLSYNSEDRAAVRVIADRLKERGIVPWLDDEQMWAGRLATRQLAEQIKKVRSVAVFLGDHGLGRWQDLEIESFLRQFQQRNCPIIPVILPGTQTAPEIPLFLEGFTLMDFRRRDLDPLEHLIRGIKG
jgi:GTPase SAR1 family protein